MVQTGLLGEVAGGRRIVVDNNLVYQTEDVEYPVLAGGPELPPDPDGSPADLGALWAGADHEMWWWADFPPVIDRSDPRIPGE